MYDQHMSRVVGFVNGQAALCPGGRQLAIPPNSCHPHHDFDGLRHFFTATFLLVNYPTSGITASILQYIMWEATEQLERSDLIVTFQTGDGGSPHWKNFELHGEFYKEISAYSPEVKWLYLFQMCHI